jgi:hypothetical protein
MSKAKPSRHATRTEEGSGGSWASWMANNWVLLASVVGAVVAVIAAQWFALHGSIQNLDLQGSEAIRHALKSGERWILFCDEDMRHSSMKVYQKARDAFHKVAPTLPGFHAGMLDCSRALEGSGKTVYSVIGIPLAQRPVVTVIVAANGRRPRVVPVADSVSPSKLEAFAQRVGRRTFSELSVANRKELRSCLQSPQCTILLHSGSKGRRPVKGVVEDVVEAFPLTQFAVVDTSKTWLVGLPPALQRLMPRHRGLPSTKGSPANVTEWGTNNHVDDGEGQVIVLVQRDPRGVAPAHERRRPKVSPNARAMLVNWVQAKDVGGGGSGRGLVSRRDVEDLHSHGQRCRERAGAGRGYSDRSAHPSDAAWIQSAQDLHQEDDGVVVLSDLRLTMAPKVSVQEGETARRERLLAEREGRRRERATVSDPDEKERRERATRAAMEEEEAQWFPQEVDSDEYSEALAAEYEEEEGEFVEVD